MEAVKVGDLLGHFSIVTAFKGVEGTAMVVSCDDRHNIKLWDIRTTKCIQEMRILSMQYCPLIISLETNSIRNEIEKSNR